jgi:cell division protein FtsN
LARRKRKVDLARNEEGEFELVLGNRQLVSVFLIVVVLLGVFFSMGYLVGRNTSAVPTVDTAARPTKPIVIENPSRAASGDAPASTETTPSSSPSRSPQVEPINPAAEAAKPERSRRPEPPPPTPPKHETPPVETQAGKPSFEEPRSGQTFLQVVATTRPDAELVAETLAKKGFHTTVAAGPSPALFRVLVGPLKDGADVTETRVRLEAVGFKNPYVRKIP